MFKKNNMDLIPILRGSVNLKVNDVNSAVGYAAIGGVAYTTYQISEKSPAKIAAGCIGTVALGLIWYYTKNEDRKGTKARYEHEERLAMIKHPKTSMQTDNEKNLCAFAEQNEQEPVGVSTSLPIPIEENPNDILSRVSTIQNETFWTENILHNNGVNWLTSRSGQGKSIIAAQLGIEAATGGISLLVPQGNGTAFEPIQVFWYDVELDDDDIYRRYFQRDFTFPNSFKRVTDCDFPNESMLLEDIKARVRKNSKNCAVIIDNLTSIVPTIQPAKMNEFHYGLKQIRKEAKQLGFSVTFLVVVHTKSGEMWEPITDNTFAGSVQVARCATTLTAIEPTRIADDIKIIKNIKDRKNAKNPMVSLVKLVETPYLHYEYLEDAKELDVLALKPKATRTAAPKKTNKKQKVSNEDVKRIKEMKTEGITVEDIAKKFNVSRKTIYDKLKL